jgi:hypothetical protein
MSKAEVINVAKDRKPGRPADPEGPNKPIGLRPRRKLRLALEKYIADQDVHVFQSQVLAAALSEFLEKRGYYKE